MTGARRAAFAGVFSLLLAALGACGEGDGPAPASGNRFVREDAQRLVVQSSELPQQSQVRQSRDEDVAAVVEQVPGSRKTDILSAHQKIVTIHPNRQVVSLAIIATSEAAAGRLYEGVRKVYEPRASGRPDVRTSVGPTPDVGEQSFSVAVDAEADGWIMGWRIDNAVMLLQASGPEGFPGDAVIGFAYAISARAKSTP